jgi:hypothetical protein
VTLFKAQQVQSVMRYYTVPARLSHWPAPPPSYNVPVGRSN